MMMKPCCPTSKPMNEIKRLALSIYWLKPTATIVNRKNHKCSPSQKPLDLLKNFVFWDVKGRVQL